MLKLSSILNHILKGVRADDTRFIVEGDEHITDTSTGVTLHVYDNWFKLTHDDDNVIVKEDFTAEEQALIWEIKKLITPAHVLEEREANYKPLQKARRAKLSELYESPTPLATNAPVAEENATDYIG
jgi:hypothetical protein